MGAFLNCDRCGAALIQCEGLAPYCNDCGWQKVDTLRIRFPQDFFKQYARGRECLIRVSAVCGYECSDWDTTVLCHPTLAGLKAVGSRKASVPDIGAAWGCRVCHDLIDGRMKPRKGSPVDEIDNATARRMFMQNAHLEGVIRTINELVKAGVLPNP